MGRDTVRGTLELNYTLYTGGKIDAIINQAKLNKELAKISIEPALSPGFYK